MLNFRPHSHGPLTCTKLNPQFKWKLCVKYNYITNANSFNAKYRNPKARDLHLCKLQSVYQKLCLCHLYLHFYYGYRFLRIFFGSFSQLDTTSSHTGLWSLRPRTIVSLKLNLHKTIIYNLFIRT